MHSDMVQQLRNCRLDRRHIGSLVTSLPASDRELDQLMETLIQAGEETALTTLLFAIAAGERTFEARHLAVVAPLLVNIDDLPVAALHARGEVVEALIKAAQQKQCGWQREALLLLLAGWIHKTREPDRPLPGKLIPCARQLAREAHFSPVTMLPLYALAETVDNSTLRMVLDNIGPAPPDEVIKAVICEFCELPMTDPLAGLPERADRVLHEGGTLRRAVSKIGRNDPCPCGSGRKYKKCCFDKDQERLRHSSEIAGVTTDEIDTMPEPFLTEDRIYALRAHKLARIRIDQVSPDLQGLVLERLALFHHTELLVTAWEKIGWREDLESAWEGCLFELVQQRRQDAVARLVALRGVPAEDDAVPFDARLLLLEDNPVEYFRIAEEIALESVKNPLDTRYIDIAHAMVEGRFPGLGTLLARGAAITGSVWDAAVLFQSIGLVRDRLDLPPEDPAEKVLDGRFELPEGIDEREREQLDAARREMEVSATEVSRLRNQLEETNARLERQERLAARASSEAAPTPDTPMEPDPEVIELRHRINELKSSLTERHAERNALRRELSQAISEAESFRHRAAATDESADQAAEATAEEAALTSAEITSSQPARLPVFPSRFQNTLTSFPESVRRAALSLIGRLAAGEPNAFAGMRRLRIHHDICRVRVGADYRLFFRLETDQVEILDLINRRDFDRWLKNRS